MTDIHRRAGSKTLELLHARDCTSTGLSANGNHIVTRTPLCYGYSKICGKHRLIFGDKFGGYCRRPVSTRSSG